MTDLPTPDDIRERVADAFPPERRRRALDWAATPEGRAALQAHRAELHRIPKPADPCAPENIAITLHKPARPSRWANLAGQAAAAAWWVLCAVVAAGWLYGVECYPHLWGAP